MSQSVCQFCPQTHHEPSGGFPPNQALEKMLAIELNSLTFSSKFTKSQACITHLQKSCQEIDLIQKDPASYVYEYFEDLKREVDIRREHVKHQVDTYSNELITEISKYQEQCSQVNSQASEASEQIESLRTEINNLITRFDTFEFSDEKFDGIIKDAAVLKPVVASSLENYKSLLVGNQEYGFKFDEAVSVSDVFGSIKVSPVFIVN